MEGDIHVDPEGRRIEWNSKSQDSNYTTNLNINGIANRNRKEYLNLKLKNLKSES